MPNYQPIVVKGIPVSVNSSSTNLRRWKAKIAKEASLIFSCPLVDHDLRLIITCFGDGNRFYDTDNVSKPICDALKGIVYADDNQVMERTAKYRDLNGSYHIKGIPPSVAVALAEGDEFVSISIENVGSGVEII